MKSLFLSLFLLGGLLSAQDVAMQEPQFSSPHADGPALVYRAAETTTASSRSYSLRRERTLFGDLDLSGAWGGPTYNYSSTGSDWSLVRGGFGGLEFSESVFIGYGGWSAREPFTTDEAPVAPAVAPKYDFRHGGFIIAYAPGMDKIVHPRFTAIIGPGRIDITNEDALGVEPINRDRILVGQLMGGAEINVTQWFRLGLEGGYRFASGVDEGSPVTASDVSGAVVQIEARFGFSW